MRYKILQSANSLRGGIGVVIDNIIKNLPKDIFDLELLLLEKTKRYSFKDYFEYKKELNYKHYDLIHLHGDWYFHIAAFRKKQKSKIIISPHGAFDKVSLQKSFLKKRLRLFYI